MEFNIYEKENLIIEKKLIKSEKNRLIFSIFLISFSIILIPLYFYISFTYTINNNYTLAILNFFISLLWVFNFYMNIKLLKKSKKNIKYFTDRYYDRLKRTDLPRYIKEQRIKKLKKLK